MPMPTCRRNCQVLNTSDEGSGVPTHKEAPGRHDVEHADGIAVIVRPGGEGREDEENHGREQQRVGARPLVRQIAKSKLPDHRAGKGNIAQVVLRVGRLPHIAVLDRENGDDRANDLNAASCQSDIAKTQAHTDTRACKAVGKPPTLLM